MCSASEPPSLPGLQIWYAPRWYARDCSPLICPQLSAHEHHLTSSYIILSNHIHIIHRKSNHPIICTSSHHHFTFVVLHMFFIVPSTVCSEKYYHHTISNQCLRCDRPKSIIHGSILIFAGPVWELLESVRWSARTRDIGQGSTRK